MIRKLSESDRSTLLSYVGIEPAINLFIIGDVEAFGFDSDVQELFGRFEDGILTGVLLRYRNNFIVYHDGGYIPEFWDIISKAALEGEVFFSGKESILNEYPKMPPGYKRKLTYFCELKDDSLLEKGPFDDIKTATAEDAPEVVELLSTIEEFRPLSQSSINMAAKINNGSGRVYFIADENGKPISVSQTTAENSMSAMIVGVATDVNYRRRGLMGRCLSKLSADLLKEGKSLCLFYDNPEAGSTYHRLGYKTIGRWVMWKHM